MPPEMGEAFNAVKRAMEMFTTFMANQGRRGGHNPLPPGRRDGSMSSRGCLIRGLQYLLSLRHRQVKVFQADIAKVMGASLARIRTSELHSLRVRVVLDNHPTRESLAVLARRAIQVSAGVEYEVVTTVEILDT
ncbi:hypothetical protein HAX54_023629 [Datura stramonium]|uniref:Uncharacterized protein n=1 Tax=Datura stramonium TaxID=4076 RepID=A0ABS8S5W3_DATST|nr:hypothetical protein [Datura stramonium]